jgi:aminoglycoside 6'-N-acetyltransferase I
MALTEMREARESDIEALARMRFELWPESTLEEQREELGIALAGMSGTLPVTTLVACDASDRPIGFVEAGLRSHADGCHVSHPVGFVEGWFVDPGWRGQGVGAALIVAAEAWAREQGCREMASDALINNEESIAAHQALGFEVVDRCVHFRKAL